MRAHFCKMSRWHRERNTEISLFCCHIQCRTKRRRLPVLLPVLGLGWGRFFFSDWLLFLSAVCVKHGEEKKRKTNLTTRTRGWQHSANHSRVCAEPQPIGGQGAREQCVLVRRLEEMGCVAVGGRGHQSQQCQGKPGELPAGKLGERSIRSMLHSQGVGIPCWKRSDSSLRR